MPILIDGKRHDTVRDLAERFNYTEAYVRQMAVDHGKKIGASKRGRRWVFIPGKFKEFIMKESANDGSVAGDGDEW